MKSESHDTARLENQGRVRLVRLVRLFSISLLYPITICI